jgi:ribosomal protein L31
MATHDLLTPTMIAREALRLLRNNMVMGGLVHRAYESEFPGSPKKGGSVQIRKPVKFVVTKSRVRSTSTISEQYITLDVSTQAHVSWNFFSVDLTLTIEEYSERYIRPAAAVLANTVDADLCALYDDVYNTVWESTGFVNPATFMVLGKAMQRLDEEAAPPDDRVIVLNPAAHWSMANALSNWNFKEGGEKALRKGYVGMVANADVYMDQNIKAHTAGTVHDTGSTNSDVILVASTAATLVTGLVAGGSNNQKLELYNMRTTADVSHQWRVGDFFEIANVYAVNPMSGESTGKRRQFVVTADASGGSDTGAGTAGGVIVYVQPDMVNTGPYKTIDTVPAGQAVVYVYWTQNKVSPPNLAFHKNAFALCMVPLEKPDGQWGTTVTENGISIRVVKDYDIDVDSEIIRLDILYGVKTIYPELACRILGEEV